MYEKLKGVVLHIIKYSDKNSIVHVLTDIYGKIAFLLPQGTGKSSKMKNAIFMPLSLVEIETKIIPGRDIYAIKEAHLVYTVSTIHADPMKNAIAMFMTELIGRVIHEREQNRSLFRYVAASVEFLDKMEKGIANFHICFLYNLGTFMGIQPYTETYRENFWFDMANGEFTPYKPPHNHILNPEEAKTIIMLSRMSFGNLHVFAFNREQRNSILDTMLKYFQIHNSTLGLMKSPEILKQLFS